MDTKEAILELRKSLNLSQSDFAKRLLVTRQAVSRWENGHVIPNVDTLKWMAEAFGVPVDYLLGAPAGQCQSCAMALAHDSDKGTERDGGKSEDYCVFCYQQGEMTQDITMEEMVEHNLRYLNEWNESAGLQLTEPEARAALLGFLPTLKRWKGKPTAMARD